MRAPRITVIGSLNMDLVVRAPRMPAPGETIMGSDFQTIPGGKGANQAVAAAKLGAQVTMVGRVGDDDLGRAQLKGLSSLGIDVGHVTVDAEARTGIALITLDAAGQNSIVLAPGANMCLSEGDADRARERIASSQALVLQMEVPLPVVEHAVALAHRSGVRVVLNPAPAQQLSPRTLGMVDFLIPNESEATILTGLGVKDLNSAAEASAQLHHRGAKAVVLTLGDRGALLYTAEGGVQLPGYEVEVVDTTAAGDAFVAGFTVAIAEGQDLRKAVAFANAAGALKVTKMGAQPSLPYRQEVEDFLAARGVPEGEVVS